MKNTFLKKAWFWAALIVTLVIGYYSFEVIIARTHTIETVEYYYDTGQMKMTAGDLSPRQLEILLKVEDPSFYDHHGVDFKTPGAGWTTITQGLAKKLYFKEFKSGIMKIKQSLCARCALDPLVSKERQLDLYINIMYFGNETYGLEDAAEYYFNKDIDELEEDEFIALIACLINPEQLNIKDHPQENAVRVQRIKKVLSGAYKPQGLFDITYEGAEKI